MPKPMTPDELAQRIVSRQHVLNRARPNRHSIDRFLAMGLPIYSCECGAWQADIPDGWGDHFQEMVDNHLLQYEAEAAALERIAECDSEPECGDDHHNIARSALAALREEAAS